MRVIAGIAKGRKLKSPKGSRIRPTLDKVKGAIFNILGDKIIDANVLDLFCGSGALGIEALSRGAESCTFVDTNISCVKDNLSRVGFEGRIIRGDIQQAVRKLTREKARFDIVLSDPPYCKEMGRKLLYMLAGSGILLDSGLIVIEHSRKERFVIKSKKIVPSSINPRGDWVARSRCLEKMYGDTVVSVFLQRDIV